ncbi:MAG: iron-sulfur cluster assembly accessory protein [Gaiellales bacterium]
MSSETSEITITEAAGRKARELRTAEGRGETEVLRIGVQGGGCSGFQYLLEFDERRADDQVLDLDGLVAVVDPFSAPLLSGLILDYDGSIGGKGFEFRNPQVSAGCGCGRSFQVNEDALEALSAEA